jgi:hypothetical protein
MPRTMNGLGVAENTTWPLLLGIGMSMAGCAGQVSSCCGGSACASQVKGAVRVTGVAGRVGSCAAGGLREVPVAGPSDGGATATTASRQNRTPTTAIVAISKPAAPPTPSHTHNATLPDDVPELARALEGIGLRGAAAGSTGPRWAGFDGPKPPSPSGFSAWAGVPGAGIAMILPHTGQMTRSPADASSACHAFPHWHFTRSDMTEPRQ